MELSETNKCFVNFEVITGIFSPFSCIKTAVFQSKKVASVRGYVAAYPLHNAPQTEWMTLIWVLLFYPHLIKFGIKRASDVITAVEMYIVYCTESTMAYTFEYSSWENHHGSWQSSESTHRRFISWLEIM